MSNGIASLPAILAEMSLAELRLMLLFIEWLETNKVELSGHRER
ncbi:hypothetical protein ES703_124586 [subsurface metagenome]